jgi:hypothetical protein
MKTARCTLLATIVVLLLGGANLRAESKWSIPKLWPLGDQRASKKKSSFLTASLSKRSSATSRSTRSKKASRWRPSFNSLAAAPKNLWAGTKRLLPPWGKKKAVETEPSRSSRRRRVLDSKRASGPKTMEGFLKQKRPSF